MERLPIPPAEKLIDLLLDAVVGVDLQGRFVFASAACERIFGYTGEEMIGREMIEMVLPEDRERTLVAARQVIAGVPLTNFENRYVRKDGSVVDIMWSARWSEPDGVRMAVARDVSEQRRNQVVQSVLYAISEAAHVAEDLPTLFRDIHQSIGRLLPATNFFVALYDASRDELSYPYHVDQFDPVPAAGPLDTTALSAEVIRTGRTLLVTPESQACLPAHLQPVVGTDSRYWLGVPLSANHRTFGALVVQSYAGGVEYSERDKDLLQFVSVQIAAAIERKRMHARLQHIALYDQLTGLPNRELLRDRLRGALARARREQGQVALLYLDLDNFKQVNDRHGHALGDAVLQESARRLQASVRQDDTVSRLGGDEFVVLLERITRPEQAFAIAAKLRAAFDTPMSLAGHALTVSPSIGVAIHPDDGDSEDALLGLADAAMYRAKRGGGNRIGHADNPLPIAKSADHTG